MDSRNINDVFAVKNCTRTDGADTIDTKAITGVQIKASKVDAGTAATTFYGAGELVVTDVAGNVLTTATALKTVPSIKLHQREYNGKGFHGSKEIRGKDIVGYTLTPYKAPVECMVGVTGIDASLVNYAYTITLKLYPTVARTDYIYDQELTFGYVSGSTASTAAEIYQGLADEINKYYGENVGADFELEASYVSTGAGGLLIKALPNVWDIDSFKFSQTRFTDTTLNATATVSSNLYAENTFLTTVYAMADKGAGHYPLVAWEEYSAQMNRGVNRNRGLAENLRNLVPLSAQEFENDGSTDNRYDELTINWEYTGNHTLTGTMQRGTIHIYLPVDDNATSQVGVATTGIVAVLDKYIATEHGVSVAQIGNLS